MAILYELKLVCESNHIWCGMARKHLQNLSSHDRSDFQSRSRLAETVTKTRGAMIINKIRCENKDSMNIDSPMIDV